MNLYEDERSLIQLGWGAVGIHKLDMVRILELSINLNEKQI